MLKYNASFDKKEEKKKNVAKYHIFLEKAINFKSQQVFYSLKLTDLNGNHFYSS